MRNVMAIDNGKIIGISSAASGVSYDNTNSGLTSTNVQDAINEVCNDLSDKVDTVAGKGLSTNDYDDTAKGIVDGVTSALADKADASSVPTKTSDLTNDSGFITNLVNNLLNYYLKSETYSKTEVDSLLQAITALDIQAVSQLPTTNISTTTIYLVPKQSLSSQDVKDEYINLDGTTAGWERIGTTEIDLSNYVTTSDLTTALADYVTSEQFNKEFFIGTQAAWNSLTVSQKTEYTFAVITDDYDDNHVGNLNALTTTDKSSCVGAINELNDSSFDTVTIEPTYAVSDQNWEIERLGKLRILRIKHLQSIPSGDTNIGSVSSQDIPHNTAQIKVWGSTTDSHYNVVVNTSGIISIHSYSQTPTASEVLTAELVYVV